MNRLMSGAVTLAVIAAAPFLSISPCQASAPKYTITRTVSLGAPDRWDYLAFDTKSKRVFVSHGDRVTIVNADDGSIAGQVEGFAGGTHGIVILTAAGRGYTDDGRAGTAASFDLTTFEVGKAIAADDDADGIAFDRVSGHLFVVDGDPGKLTVIDPKTDAVVANVDAGGKLEFAVSGNNGYLYVNGEAKHEIVRVDTRTNKVDAHWPMPTCESPHGLAIDTSTHRLFSGCINSVLVVMDSANGKIIASVPIGRGSDAVAFDPKRKLIFSSNGQDGTLSVIQEADARTFVPVATIPTAVSGRTMTIDPETGQLYVAAAEVDTKAAAAMSPPPRRMPLVPGSLKLLILDPTP
jgi:DNA-binding beta-propeller fold protein YncE